MIPRCSVFIATSLDGFIARADGSIDWLETANACVPPGEDCGYGAFIASVDALVMGRQTFESVLAFDPWPYGGLPVVVQSRRSLDIPARLAPTVSASAEAPAELAERLGAAGARHLYIDGGETIRRFLAAGLIDEMTITTVPVLLGEGRPLFGGPAADRPLALIASRAWPFGFVQNRYRVVRGAAA
jgi:dihydrofolate reductase